MLCKAAWLCIVSGFSRQPLNHEEIVSDWRTQWGEVLRVY